jgi:glucose-1-phosphate adenylyltransferase
MLSSRLASRTQAFILAGGQGQRLYPLTRFRAKAAVPVGGVYRLIDFTLSNCFNSRFSRTNVLTQYQSDSLHSHVRDWTLQRNLPRSGQSVMCLPPVSGKRYRGTVDAVFQNLPVLEDAQPEFVVILTGNQVYKMDYRELLAFHAEQGADVTVAAVERTDSLVNMGVYVFNTRTLIEAVSGSAHTDRDFARDIIPELVRSRRVPVFDFAKMGTRFGSYWRDVNSLESYYRLNMELLLSSYLDAYAGAGWPLYGLEGTRYTGFRDTEQAPAGRVTDSIVPRGVSIDPGALVVHSVLSPGVRIESGAVVQNSVLLHDVRVGAGARIQRVIADENVQIDDGVELGLDEVADRRHGLLTESGLGVVPANTYVGASPMAGPAQPAVNGFVADDPFKTQQFR